jgi:hypothetical protein
MEAPVFHRKAGLVCIGLSEAHGGSINLISFYKHFPLAVAEYPAVAFTISCHLSENS